MSPSKAVGPAYPGPTRSDPKKQHYQALRHLFGDAITPYEEELLGKYLTHLNVVGDDGDYPDFEAWYQAVRYAQGTGAPRTLEEAAELRFKDVLEAARVFNRLHATRN